jgi:hypothetical protein
MRCIRITNRGIIYPSFESKNTRKSRIERLHTSYVYVCAKFREIPKRPALHLAPLMPNSENKSSWSTRRLGILVMGEAVRLILVPSIHHLSPTSHCLGIIPSLPPPPKPPQYDNMSDQPGLSHFQVLFESALQDYEKKTGITLTNHPLAERLQTCHSAESVTALLQEQTRALGEFRESDKIMRSLKNVVSVLSKISATAALGKDFGTVCLRPLIGCSTDLNA